MPAPSVVLRALPLLVSRVRIARRYGGSLVTGRGRWKIEGTRSSLQMNIITNIGSF